MGIGGCPGGAVVKNPAAMQEAWGQPLDQEDPSPQEGTDNQLQYSCLGNPKDSGAWWAAAHGIIKSWIQLNTHTHTHTHTHAHAFISTDS